MMILLILLVLGVCFLPVMVGTLLFSFVGGVASLLLIVSIIVAVGVLGDKFILKIVKARPAPEGHKIHCTTRNYSCRLEQETIDVYFSNRFKNNVYCVNSLAGRPSIIIGVAMMRDLTQQELESIIFASILGIKDGVAKFKTISVLILAIYSLPLLLLKSRNWPKAPNFIRNILNFYFLPIVGVRGYFYRRKSRLVSFDKKVIRLFGHEKELSSAICKISTKEAMTSRSLTQNIMSDLAFVENRSDDVLSMFFKFGFVAKDRYEAMVNIR